MSEEEKKESNGVLFIKMVLGLAMLGYGLYLIFS